MKKGREIYEPGAIGPNIPIDTGARNSYGRAIFREKPTDQIFHRVMDARQGLMSELASPVLPIAPVVGIPILENGQIPHPRRDDFYSTAINELKIGDHITHEQYEELSGTIIAVALVFNDLDHLIQLDRSGTKIINRLNIGIKDGLPMLFDLGEARAPIHEMITKQRLIEVYFTYFQNSDACSRTRVSIENAYKKVTAMLEFYETPDGKEHFKKSLQKSEASQVKIAPDSTFVESVEKMLDIFLSNLRTVKEFLNEKIKEFV